MQDHSSVRKHVKRLSILVFLIVILFPLSNVAVPSTSGSVINEGHSYDAIKRGERLFLGLLPFDRKYASCVSCHNINPVDTLNWNPSARDIALKIQGMDENAFVQVLLQPNGTKMSAVHKEFDLKEEDIKAVKAFLIDLGHRGPTKEKTTHFNLILFLFLGILITWAIVELLFLKKIKIKIIPLIVLLGGFSLQVRMIVTDAIKLGRQENYAPDQPIKFSHRVHAGDNKIDCMYCHTTVEEGKSAGIPAVDLCMNCHVIVREGTHSGKFEIAKVVAAAEEGRPVEWNRVHNLPDHVFFNHAVHVGSGKLDCAQCHGPVEEMDIMRQYSDLSMGWCVNCHRETNVDFVNNDYYRHHVKLQEDLKSGKRKAVTANDIGANDCMRCHY